MLAAPTASYVYRGFILAPAASVDLSLAKSIEYQVRASTDSVQYTGWQSLGSVTSAVGFEFVHTALLAGVFYEYQMQITYIDGTGSGWSDYCIAGNGTGVNDPTLDQTAAALGTISSGYMRGVIFETSANYPKVRMDPTGFYSVTTTSTPVAILAGGSATFTGNILASTLSGSQLTGGRIQTAATNPRLVLDSTGFYSITSGSTPSTATPVQILASGAASFSGNLTVSSLVLSETTYVTGVFYKSGGQTSDSVTWVDNMNQNRAVIYAKGYGGTTINQFATPQDVQIWASAAGPQNLNAGSTADALILDSGGNSSFVGFQGSTPTSNAGMAFGTTQITWPGANSFSNIVTFNHNLRRLPTTAVLTIDPNSGTNPAAVYCTVAHASAPTSTQLQVQAQTGGSQPAAGKTAIVHFIVIG